MFEWNGEAKGNGIPTLFSVSFGTNYSTVVSTGSALINKTGALAGYNGNFSMAVPVTNSFSVRTGVGFSGEGTQNKTIGYQFRVTYFNLPLLASFNPQPNKGLHILAGPNFGFLVSANEKNNAIKSDLHQSLKTANISLFGGIEYMPKTIGVQLAYLYGLTNIGRDAAYAGNTRTVCLSLLHRLVYKKQSSELAPQ